MRNLIVGVVVNVLRKVFVQIFKFAGVDGISAIVRDSPELVVLYPKIALDYFCGGRES